MQDRQPPFDYTRASDLMEQHGVEALLVCSRANVGYLADYTYYTGQGLPFLLEDGREWSLSFVGLPRDATLGAFLSSVTGEEGTVAHADPWIADRRFWGPPWTYQGRGSASAVPPADVAVCVADALRERGLGNGRIALELAALSTARYLRLKEALPQADFVDAAPILWELRRIKTAEEIARLRRIATMTDAAVAAGYAALNGGYSERDFERMMAGSLIRQGAIYGWCSIAYGPKGATLVEPTDQLPAAGEIVRIDLVGSYRGYYSDISRVAAFARAPNADAQRAHAAILETNAVMRREVGPGVRCADLWRLARESLGARGYPLLAPAAGHGVGRDVGEPPFLAEREETTLVPGMVLALEPTMRVVGIGSVNIEDMVLVTDNGCEPLTTFPRELLVYGQAH